MRMVFLLLTMLALSFPALAVEPDEMLQDPVLEARAREISKNLRCLVCQGEAVDESNAGFAKDLRLLVRERLQAGDTDEDVVLFLRARYGDFILLTPPLEEKTYLLWLTPILMLGAGIYITRRLIKSRR